ncbi:MAG: transcriptional regulator [Gallionellales bacterium RBG_16_56_9]|nr:MAG: transcriptional regulator [Gallionellales bacterium RBG_16_56_9]
MKQVKAFIHPHRMNAVTTALRDSGLCDINAGPGCYHLAVSNMQRLYTSADPSQQHYSLDLAEPVVAETKLELICEDALADQVAALIAQAGGPSSGWVFVTDIQSAIPIK